MRFYIFTLGKAGPVKVGISENTERRLGQLQTGNPYVIGRWLEYEMGLEEARECERRLLKELEDCRLEGEWLDVSEQFIGSYIDDFFKALGLDPRVV